MYCSKALTMAALVVLMLINSGTSRNQCETWRGNDFRDCTCGVQYRDYERTCENSNTYLDPRLGQANHTCPFKCENDGHLFHLGHDHYFCSCKPGFGGRCCETGKELNCTITEGEKIHYNDKITVYDGPDKSTKQVGPFCGKARPFQTIHSSGRHLYIEFQTNNDITKNGFKLNYTTYREGNRCGPRKEYHLPTAVISSPQFPLSYSPNENCEYEIFVEENQEVVLTTLVMNLTSSADCSSGDVIEVLKADSEDEYLPVTKLCGRGNYAPFTVRNTTSILLKFSSGFSTDGSFQLRYQGKLRVMTLPLFHPKCIHFSCCL